MGSGIFVRVAEILEESLGQAVSYNPQRVSAAWDIARMLSIDAVGVRKRSGLPSDVPPEWDCILGELNSMLRGVSPQLNDGNDARPFGVACGIAWSSHYLISRSLSSSDTRPFVISGLPSVYNSHDKWEFPISLLIPSDVPFATADDLLRTTVDFLGKYGDYTDLRFCSDKPAHSLLLLNDTPITLIESTLYSDAQLSRYSFDWAFVHQCRTHGIDAPLIRASTLPADMPPTTSDELFSSHAYSIAVRDKPSDVYRLLLLPDVLVDYWIAAISDPHRFTLATALHEAAHIASGRCASSDSLDYWLRDEPQAIARVLRAADALGWEKGRECPSFSIEVRSYPDDVPERPLLQELNEKPVMQ